MSIKGKNILITGATGFVSANLVRHFLKKGANISILKRQQSNLWRIKDIINQISAYNADLLDSCLKSGFGLFVNTGSSSEYGVQDSPMRESDLLKPVTLYGVSKAAASILLPICSQET